MRLTFILLISVLFQYTGSGQIRGQLINSDSTTLNSAIVKLMKIDGKDTLLSQSTTLDSLGVYNFEKVSSGIYLIESSAEGYLTVKSPVFQVRDDRDIIRLSPLIMPHITSELEKVTITTRKPIYQYKSEGIVVNVNNSLLTKGSSILEILERLPGLQIDHRSNSISLNGKTGVTIMLDGRMMRMSTEQLMSLLNGINSNDIEKIELLNSPTANYDAEGSAGIINIILKKNNKKGTNGSFSVTGGYGWREKAQTNFNITHSIGKFNLYGSYSFLYNHTFSMFHGIGSQVIPSLGFMDFDATSYTYAITNDHNINAGIDFLINKKMTIGGSLNYAGSKGNTTTTNESIYLIEPDSTLKFNGNTGGKNNWNNVLTNLYYEFKINDKEKINISSNYLFFNNSIQSNIQNQFLNKQGKEFISSSNQFSLEQKGFSSANIKVSTIKLDYQRELSRYLNFATGYKQDISINNSNSGIAAMTTGNWVNRNETLNKNRIKESIYAGYVSLNLQIDPEIKIMGGIRYEHYGMIAKNLLSMKDTVNRHTGQFFPNFTFSNQIGNNKELQFSYSKRITRPSYNDLASNIFYNDPFSIFTGNSFLNSTVSDNIKIGFVSQDYSFSLLGSKEKYPIAQYQNSVGPTKTLVYTRPENLVYQDIINIQVIAPIQIKQWWKMNYTITAGWRQFKMDYTVNPIRKSYWSYSMNFNESLSLPKKYSFEVSGWINGSTYLGATKTPMNGVLNIGLKKSIGEKGANLQLSVSDLLGTMYFNHNYGYYSEDPFYSKYHVKWRSESTKFPIIKLTYTLPFGINSNKHSKEVSDTDILNRIRH